MTGFLFFILIPFLLIIFIGLSILGQILKIFGIGKNIFNTSFKREESPNDKTDSQEKDFTRTSYSSNSSRKQSHPSGRRKIFGDDEGEYVDFEEVK